MKRYPHRIVTGKRPGGNGKAKAEDVATGQQAPVIETVEPVCICPTRIIDGRLWRSHSPDCSSLGLFTQSAYTGRVERAAVSRSKYHKAGAE